MGSGRVLAMAAVAASWPAVTQGARRRAQRAARSGPPRAPRRADAPTGPGCRRAAHRGRRLPRTPGRRGGVDARAGPAAPTQTKHSPVALRWSRANPTGLQSVSRPARLVDQPRPGGQGPARCWPSRNQRLAAGASRKRSAATVGAQPLPLARHRRGRDRALRWRYLRPAAAIKFENQSQTLLVDAGDPGYAVAIPAPPAGAAESGTGGVERLSRITSTSRNSSRAKKKKKHRRRRGGRHHRVGRDQIGHTGLLATQHLNDVA